MPMWGFDMFPRNKICNCFGPVTRKQSCIGRPPVLIHTFSIWQMLLCAELVYMLYCSDPRITQVFKSQRKSPRAECSVLHNQAQHSLLHKYVQVFFEPAPVSSFKAVLNNSTPTIMEYKYVI